MKIIILGTWSILRFDMYYCISFSEYGEDSPFAYQLRKNKWLKGNELNEEIDRPMKIKDHKKLNFLDFLHLNTGVECSDTSNGATDYFGESCIINDEQNVISGYCGETEQMFFFKNRLN